METVVEVKVSTTQEKPKLEGPTHLIFIIDRSGSMSRHLESTINQFNKMLAQQQAMVDDGSIASLYQFNHDSQKHLSRVPLRHVPALDKTTYVPNGNTALLDALGFAINENGMDRKVFLAIFTDGEENASKHFTKETIKFLIDQKEEAGWDVNYVGSSLAGFKEASKYGFRSDKSVLVANSAEGMNDAYGYMNTTAASYRTTGQARPGQ